MATKLFAFNRSIPAPFDKVGKKVKISSIYGSGTEATLTSTVVKAILAYCGCRDGTKPGALGCCGRKGVAEYKSASGPNSYHLVVYDQDTGAAMASCYDSGTETMETYVARSSVKDGAAILMAMIPALMEDKEFGDALVNFETEFKGGFADLSAATEYLGLLCDNAYRRVVDESCAAHLKLNIDKAGNVPRISQGHLDSGKFAPDNVLGGEFTILAHSVAVPAPLKPAEAVSHSDFVGKYVLTPARILTAHERALVPVLEPWYILPKEVISICKHAQRSTGKALPMRNFLLRGPAGTGKTEGAKAIAAGLSLPYMKYTCSANTEVFDFIGQIFPDTSGPSTGDADLDRERAELKAMGGINFANVKKLMGLPDLDDMDYDPAGVYQALTGMEKADAVAQDCIAAVLEKVTAARSFRPCCPPGFKCGTRLSL